MSLLIYYLIGVCFYPYFYKIGALEDLKGTKYPMIAKIGAVLIIPFLWPLFAIIIIVGRLT